MAAEGNRHHGATDLVEHTEADAAVEHIQRLYATAAGAIRDNFARFAAGEAVSRVAANYPYLGIEVGAGRLHAVALRSFGALHSEGTFGATLTRPDLFAEYYREQVELLLFHHGPPVVVGTSDRPIPLPFVAEESTADLTPGDAARLQECFALPELRAIDDAIVNGTVPVTPGQLRPLALFTAERVDYSLQRLVHYTGTSPEHFQNFVLLTNYARYVEQFVTRAEAHMRTDTTITEFVGPGDRITPNPLGGGEVAGEAPSHLPQMPAYHLKRADRSGITLINMGVGPSNARTITDHVAVLRPHCWLMLGHCAGLRRSQLLGDYVLAHGYIREDGVLDQELPPWVPVPPIAEIQVALQEAVTEVTGLEGIERKTRMRTGTVASTDNRNWELRYAELYERFNQSRAIAVDMESATIAANGFRFRVPYGTLLCVSDKPMHGEIKLRGMANAFYRERIDQHLAIGLETVRILRERGVEALHSRKLRGFDDPAFR